MATMAKKAKKQTFGKRGYTVRKYALVSTLYRKNIDLTEYTRILKLVVNEYNKLNFTQFAIIVQSNCYYLIGRATTGRLKSLGRQIAYIESLQQYAYTAPNGKQRLFHCIAKK